jgi:hypothetical protein
MFNRTDKVDWRKCNVAVTIIEIRPFRNGWQVFACINMRQTTNEFVMSLFDSCQSKQRGRAFERREFDAAGKSEFGSSIFAY